MSAPTGSPQNSEGLRERNAAPSTKDDTYASASSSEDEAEDVKAADKEKKTFGRTPDGTG